MTATAAALRAAVAGARGQRPEQRDVLRVAQRQHLRLRAHAARVERRLALRRQGRGGHPAAEHDRHVALGERAQLRRARAIQHEAGRERAQDLDRLGADRDRDAHHLQHAVRDAAEARARLAGCVGGIGCGARPAALRQQASVAAGQRQRVGPRLHAVVLRERLHGRRVAGLDRRLELRQVRDQPRHERQRLAARGLLLQEQRRRVLEPAGQLRLRLARDPAGHEDQRERDREHGDGRAGQEDAVAERRQEAHARAHLRTKSASTAPPAGTSTVRSSRSCPSFQATRR